MNAKFTLYALMLLPMGCGVNTDEVPDHKRVPAAPTEAAGAAPAPRAKVNYATYAKYVTAFIADVRAATGTTPDNHLSSITWDTVSREGRLATCTSWVITATGEITDAKITIDPINMEFASPTLLRYVMYHELGHCIMNSPHVADNTDLMYPAVSGMISDSEADAAIAHYMNTL